NEVERIAQELREQLGNGSTAKPQSEPTSTALGAKPSPTPQPPTQATPPHPATAGPQTPGDTIYIDNEGNLHAKDQPS
ncbi:MAG TPA: hypothetical protein VFI84_00255, partial [Candidatus Saccharimonadales bacterium]|nr:hypothetical protein [Candidatus Saccharimonadales bacterium]